MSVPLGRQNSHEPDKVPAVGAGNPVGSWLCPAATWELSMDMGWAFPPTESRVMRVNPEPWGTVRTPFIPQHSDWDWDWGGWDGWEHQKPSTGGAQPGGGVGSTAGNISVPGQCPESSGRAGWCLKGQRQFLCFLLLKPDPGSHRIQGRVSRLWFRASLSTLGTI